VRSVDELLCAEFGLKDGLADTTTWGEIVKNQPESIIGKSTESSIHSGVIIGVVKEIDGVIDEYKSEYQDLTVILTGGDANFLSNQLKNSIFANSNFLLEGLNYILDFNSK